MVVVLIKRQVKYKAQSPRSGLEIGPSGRQSSDPMGFAALSVSTVGEPGVLLPGSDPAPGRSCPSRLWTPSALAQVFPRRKGLSSPRTCKVAGELTDGETERETAAGAGRHARGSESSPACGAQRPPGGGEEGGAGAGRGPLRVRACGVQSGPARSYIRGPVAAGDTERVS